MNIDITNKIPFAAATSNLVNDRVGRVRIIRSFNNVCFESVAKAIKGDSRVDGLIFRGTNAVARGVAREIGINVYWLDTDRFVAANV